MKKRMKWGSLTGRTKRLLAAFMAVAMIAMLMPVMGMDTMASECPTCGGTGLVSSLVCENDPAHAFEAGSAVCADGQHLGVISNDGDDSAKECSLGCGATHDIRPVLYIEDEEGALVEVPNPAYDGDVGDSCKNIAPGCGGSIVELQSPCPDCPAEGSTRHDPGFINVPGGGSSSSSSSAPEGENATQEGGSKAEPKGDVNFIIDELGWNSDQLIDARAGHSLDQFLSIAGFSFYAERDNGESFVGTVSYNTPGGMGLYLSFGGDGTDADVEVDYTDVSLVEFKLGGGLFTADDYNGKSEILIEAKELDDGGALIISDFEWIYDTSLIPAPMEMFNAGIDFGGFFEPITPMNAGGTVIYELTEQEIIDFENSNSTGGGWGWTNVLQSNGGTYSTSSGSTLRVTGRTANNHGIDIKIAPLNLVDENNYRITVTGVVGTTGFWPNEETRVILGGAAANWPWVDSTAPSTSDGTFNLTVERTGLQLKTITTAAGGETYQTMLRIQTGGDGSNAANLDLTINTIVITDLTPVGDSGSKPNYKTEPIWGTHNFVNTSADALSSPQLGIQRLWGNGNTTLSIENANLIATETSGSGTHGLNLACGFNANDGNLRTLLQANKSYRLVLEASSTVTQYYQFGRPDSNPIAITVIDGNDSEPGVTTNASLNITPVKQTFTVDFTVNTVGENLILPGLDTGVTASVLTIYSIYIYILCDDCGNVDCTCSLPAVDCINLVSSPITKDAIPYADEAEVHRIPLGFLGASGAKSYVGLAFDIDVYGPNGLVPKPDVWGAGQFIFATGDNWGATRVADTGGYNTLRDSIFTLPSSVTNANFTTGILVLQAGNGHNNYTSIQHITKYVINSVKLVSATCVRNSCATCIADGSNIVPPPPEYPCPKPDCNGYIRQNAAPNAGTHGCSNGCDIFDDGKGGLQNWESHKYENGKCTVCGAPQCTSHSWRQYNADVHTCRNCPAWEAHKYSNFVCTACGYQHPCANGHQKKYYNADGHNCARNCGFLNFEAHSYVNFICTGCGHRHPCADGHIRAYYNADGHNCARNCGALNFEAHTYVDGVCTGCGHVLDIVEAPPEEEEEDVELGAEPEGEEVVDDSAPQPTGIIDDDVARNILEEAIAAGETPVFNIEALMAETGSSILSADMFKLIAELGVDVKVELPGGFSFTIVASSIGPNVGNFDLNFGIEMTSRATEISGTKIPANSIVIDPNFSGEFGFDIVFTFTAEQLAAAGINGNNVKLFHVDSYGNVTDTGKVKLNADGSIEFEIGHASYYVLSSEDLVALNFVESRSYTGLYIGIAIAVAVALGGSAIIVIVMKRRERREA